MEGEPVVIYKIQIAIRFETPRNEGTEIPCITLSEGNLRRGGF